MEYKCENKECGYTNNENVFLFHGGCPACGMDFDGEFTENFVPTVFHEKKEKKK